MNNFKSVIILVNILAASHQIAAMTCKDIFGAVSNKSQRVAGGMLSLGKNALSKLSNSSRTSIHVEQAQASALVRQTVFNNLLNIRNLYPELILKINNQILESIANRSAYDKDYQQKIESFLTMAKKSLTNYDPAEMDTVRSHWAPVVLSYLRFMESRAHLKNQVNDKSLLDGQKIFEQVHEYLLSKIFEKKIFNTKEPNQNLIKSLEKLLENLDTLTEVIKTNPEIGEIIELVMNRTHYYRHGHESFIHITSFLLSLKGESFELAKSLILKLMHKDAIFSDSMFIYFNRIMEYEVSIRGLPYNTTGNATNASLIEALTHYGLIATGKSSLPELGPRRLTQWMSELDRVESFYRKLANWKDQLEGWTFNELAQRMSEDLPQFNLLSQMTWSFNESYSRPLFHTYLQFLKNPRAHGWPINMVGMMVQALYRYSEAARSNEINKFTNELKQKKESHWWKLTHRNDSSKPIDILTSEIYQKLEILSINMRVNKSVERNVGINGYNSRYPDGVSFLTYETMKLVEAIDLYLEASPAMDNHRSHFSEILSFVNRRLGEFLVEAPDKVQESIGYAFRDYRTYLESNQNNSNKGPTDINFFEMMNGIGIR